MPYSVQSLASEPLLTKQHLIKPLSGNKASLSRVAVNEGALIEIAFNKIAWETA